MDVVINDLNEKFKGTSDFTAVLEYKRETEVQQDKLKFQLFSKEGELHKRGVDLLKEIDDKKIALEELRSEVNDLKQDVEKQEIQMDRIQAITEDHMKKIRILEKTRAYLGTLREIDEISQSVEAGLNDRGTKAVTEYFQLGVMAESLKNSSCENLKKYLKDNVLYWHSVLKEHFSKDFEEIVKSLKWPFASKNVAPVPSTELLQKFQALSEILIQIQLPSSLQESNSPSDVILSLPVTLLLRPLKKRFIFHFSGAKQTNQPDKPEWYFTQILAWLRDHQEFIEKHLQPVYDRLGRKGAIAKTDFTKGLVQMATEKLHWDLPHLQYDDGLFSHAVDEALGFATELREGYGYSSSEPSVLSVLTQAHFFVKWIHLEKKYSLEKLDAIMRSETAFQKNYTVEEGDFTTECVDKFLTLLCTITDRYSSLPQPGHRLQFLQLQLDLLDDFRVRMLQLLRAQENETTNLTSMIINSLSCLIFVLQEWGVTPHFLQLQYYKVQLGEGGNTDCGVFDDVISLLTTMQEDLLDKVTDAFVMEVKSKSYPYRRDRWHAMEEPDEGVTPSSVSMFRVLTSGLCALNESLTPRLRHSATTRVAQALDVLFFEELVMQVFFNPNGAARFALDIRRGLLPLLGQYMENPQTQVPRSSDACALLTLPQGSALLLKSALGDPREEISTGEILTDVGVTSLTASQAIKVLARRTDLGFS